GQAGEAAGRVGAAEVGHGNGPGGPPARAWLGRNRALVYHVARVGTIVRFGTWGKEQGWGCDLPCSPAAAAAMRAWWRPTASVSSSTPAWGHASWPPA